MVRIGTQKSSNLLNYSKSPEDIKKEIHMSKELPSFKDSIFQEMSYQLVGSQNNRAKVVDKKMQAF